MHAPISHTNDTCTKDPFSDIFVGLVKSCMPFIDLLLIDSLFGKLCEVTDLPML